MKKSRKAPVKKNNAVITEKIVSNFTNTQHDDEQDMFSKQGDILSNPKHTSGPES